MKTVFFFCVFSLVLVILCFVDFMGKFLRAGGHDFVGLGKSQDSLELIL